MSLSSSLRRVALAVALVSASATSLAADPSVEDELARQLFVKGIPVESIQPAPAAGLYEVVTENQQILYVTADGKHLISGNLFDVENQFTNLTEARKQGLRMGVLGNIKEQDMVIFPAKQEKYVVTVFTDVDCGYCQKLHNEMADYNKAGITVRYVGYPRAGLASSSFQKLQSVWCADNRQQAMTLVKQRKPIPQLSCETRLPQQFEMGRQIGITGTPTIILEDGRLIGGYLPADRLLEVLNEQS